MTGQSEDGDGPQAHRPRTKYRELGDAMLIDAMRRGDEMAIDEFLVRHQRLLNDRVRRWRMVLDHDLDDCIAELVEDIAVMIVNGRIRPTRSLAAYVLKALRVKLALRAKHDELRYEVERDATEDAAGNGDRAVMSMVSEGTARDSEGLDWEPLPIPRAIARLASMLEEGISEDEERILSWLSNFVSQRDICEWMGTTYAAGTQRIWRLRERLRSVARQHADRFDTSEQGELERFFRRMESSNISPPARRRAPGGKRGIDERK